MANSVIGTASYQVPTNGDLGSMAFQSADAIAVNAMALGTSSIAANGYSKLPNGLTLQWGSVQSNTSVGDITFPTTFTTLYSLQITVNIAATYDVTFLPAVIASNTTTANVRTANTTAKAVNYLALGV